MSMEGSSWFNDLKNGSLFHKLQRFVLIIRIIITILAIGLIIIGATVLSSTSTFNQETGLYLKRFFVDDSNFEKAEESWADAFKLESLNIDESLEQVIVSLFNGFSVVVVTGLICLLVVFSRSNAVDYTAALFLLMALGLQSSGLKSFDNVFTPLQNKTMTRMRTALVDKQMMLKKDLISALDFLMVQGNCCGLISGSDMNLFFDDFKRNLQQGWVGTVHGDGYRVSSICWTKTVDLTKTTGCYVHFFETILKPSVREMYGMAMVAQVVMLVLILIQSEIPAAKMDALRIVFADRLPTDFPID